MGKIYYMMGKSASGKDTLYKQLHEELANYKTVVLYTTRPMREGEREGVEYHFVDDAQMDTFSKEGKIVEIRTYHTVYGDWKYATIDDGQINLEQENYLMIGTLESYSKMREYYGKEVMVPLYIEVEDGERLARALERERQQEQPGYAEMCRRFLSDTEDFSEEKLALAGISKRYENRDKRQCLQEMIEDIQDGKL